MEIQTGDTVYISKKVTAEFGWNNEWSVNMDAFVGNQRPYSVYSVNEYGVILLDMESNHYAGFSFPLGSLTRTPIDPPYVFKVGDKVKIARKVTVEEGWGLAWVEQMDKYVDNGTIHTITEVDDFRGISLNLSKDAGMFAFPPSSLKLWVPEVTPLKPVDTRSIFDSTKDPVFCIDPTSLGKGDFVSFIARVEYEVTKLKKFYVKQFHSEKKKVV